VRRVIQGRGKAPPSDIGFGPRFAAPVLLGPALNPINTTMIAIALVPIAQATGVSAAPAIWLVAGLYIVSAVARPALRRVAEIFGPKKVYVAGLLCVMVGALGALVGWESSGWNPRTSTCACWCVTAR
jgi:MFS family permease